MRGPPHPNAEIHLWKSKLLHDKGSAGEKGILAQKGEAIAMALESKCLGHLNFEETYPNMKV